MTRTYLFGYNKDGPWGSAGRKTKEQILASGPFDHVNREHMRRMFALADAVIDGGSDFGFGGGDREFTEQDAEFRRRHFIAPSGIWFYDGHWWQRWYWASPYAPPGHSWHEAGASRGGALAVDALGDHYRATAICHSFGLVNGISGEAWHYQPLEIPHARALNQVWGALAVWPLPGSTPIPPPTQEDPIMATARTAKRLLDTRVHPDWGRKVRADEVVTLVVSGDRPSWAQAAIVGLTVTEPSGSGFLKAYGDTPPATSDLNFSAGQTVTNKAFVPIVNNTFKVQVAKNSSHLIVDLVGYDTILDGEL